MSVGRSDAGPGRPALACVNVRLVRQYVLGMSDKSDKRTRPHGFTRVGTSFRELRKRLSWTQLALAARAHVSRDTIHRLERGEVVDLLSLVKLLGAMGQQVAFEVQPQIRARDIRRKFAHLHEDDG